MIKQTKLRCLVAAAAMTAALAGAALPSTAVIAQVNPNVIPYQPGGLNPFMLRPRFIAPVAANNYGPAVSMGPAIGPIGTPIRVQTRQNLGAVPYILSFKAVVSRGVPARIHTRLMGGGASFSTPAPIQLCMQGGGTWEAELVLSNGRNLGVIGSFTPTNCRR